MCRSGLGSALPDPAKPPGGQLALVFRQRASGVGFRACASAHHHCKRLRHRRPLRSIGQQIFLESLTLIDALFLSLVGGLGFAVPVPGGIGAFHFIISLALSAVYGIPTELGIIYATLSHTSQAITQIVFGLGSYAYESLRK